MLRHERVTHTHTHTHIGFLLNSDCTQTDHLSSFETHLGRNFSAQWRGETGDGEFCPPHASAIVCVCIAAGGMGEHCLCVCVCVCVLGAREREREREREGERKRGRVEVTSPVRVSRGNLRLEPAVALSMPHHRGVWLRGVVMSMH